PGGRAASCAATVERPVVVRESRRKTWSRYTQSIAPVTMNFHSQSRRYGMYSYFGDTTLAFLPDWIFDGLLPLLQEFIRLARAVQKRKARNLPSHLPDALVQFWIFQLAAFIKFLPGLWNGGLLRNHPGVERTADIAQT